MNQEKAASPPKPRTPKAIQGTGRAVARHDRAGEAEGGEGEEDVGEKLRHGQPGRQGEILEQEAGGRAEHRPPASTTR